MTENIIKALRKYDLPSFVVDNVKSGKYIVFPGFCDVHVHFREPGFSYKETILSGSRAAAHGGYTCVCTMPNLNPVPDNVDNIKKQIDIIKRDSLIDIYPYASITVGQNGNELTDFAALSEYAVAFSDDGKGIQNEKVMESAMLEAKKCGKIIASHCEDNELVRGGYIHDGKYAKENNHRGICSESEWKPIERDLKIALKTGCSYHICHISCKESVGLVRKYKALGADVTCETAPHYLVLDDGDIREDGRYKMNPPLRDKSDRFALIEGIKDGTIDMIATDHAPHGSDEKSLGLEKSSFGIVGLETAFPILYTELVIKKTITLEKLIDLMSYSPRKRFSIYSGIGFSIWDLNEKYKISSDDFLSKGRATPFEGREVFGKCIAAVCNGKISYSLF